MPEDENPALDKSSKENYLYFTLPMALNDQRNSYMLWNAWIRHIMMQIPQMYLIQYHSREHILADIASENMGVLIDGDAIIGRRIWYDTWWLLYNRQKGSSGTNDTVFFDQKEIMCEIVDLRCSNDKE